MVESLKHETQERENMPYDPSHPVFTLPESGDMTIWRYMDLAKLVALLLDRSLFLSRADLLGDPFEGSMTQATVDARAVYTKGDATFSEMWSRIIRDTRSTMCVNCWHMSPHESAAMWSLYAREGLGVAVKSSIPRLTQTLTDNLADKPQPVYVGLVHYVDYTTEQIPEFNSFWPYVYKRKSFEHEKELRIVTGILPDYEGGEIFDEESFRGFKVDIDPSILVEDMYVAPGSGEWFRDVVQAVVQQFGLDCQVHESSIDGNPVY